MPQLYLGGTNWEEWGGDGHNRGLVDDGFAPTLVADENLNDSDKLLSVLGNTEWIVKWVWVELTTTAVAGNRQITIEIQDAAADVIGVIKAGVAQAASLTYNYLFAPHVSDLTAVRDSTYVMTPMPEWILPASYGVRIWDSFARDPAADDMIVQMQVVARTH